MDRERTRYGDILSLTGLRDGESQMRDGKLKKISCAAGGECGIPDPGEGRYSPILHWKTCQVIDWLSGQVGKEVRRVMGDVFELTQKLVDLYDLKTAVNLFDEQEILSSARFGCIGCPAIEASANAPRSVVRRNGVGSPLNDLYDVWWEARQPQNRLVRVKKGKAQLGPIRMEARKRLLARVLDIQQRSGVTLVTPDDETFIRRCWQEGVYPRGWSAADEEMRDIPSPLFE